MQRLNGALLELDHVNSDKRTTTYRLVEAIKFVTDLEKGISSGDNMESIVSDRIKSAYR
jgi:hypothetical protein